MWHGTGASTGTRVSSVRFAVVTWVIAGCGGGTAPHSTTAAVEAAPPAPEKPEELEQQQQLAGAAAASVPALDPFQPDRVLAPYFFVDAGDGDTDPLPLKRTRA